MGIMCLPGGAARLCLWCLVSTMLDELERRELKRALICMCVGGGMGIASIIERV